VEGENYCDFRFSETLGEGANAKVFKEKIGSKFFAIKIYLKEDLFNEEKISFMISNPPKDLFFSKNGMEYPSYAWPLAAVKNLEEGHFGKEIGYVMPLIDKERSNTLDYFYDHNLSKNLKSNRSKALSFKIEIVRNLAERLVSLHALGHKFVDLKPPNIGVYEGTNFVSFLDCDGFDINYPQSKKRITIPMVSPDYISPELAEITGTVTAIDISQDHYALAVMIFQTLNYGIHPFQGITKDPNIHISTNDEAAALGLYPYGLSGSTRIAPNRHSIHETFLPATRTLFDRAFTIGEKRPSAAEWAEHFNKILEDKLLARCAVFPNDPTHIRFKDQLCPACLLEEKKKASSQSPHVSMKSSVKNFEEISSNYTNTPLNEKKSLANQNLAGFAICVIFVWLIYFLTASPPLKPVDTPSPINSNIDARIPTNPNDTTDLRSWTSDAICRRALTGDGSNWDTRKNYETAVLEAKRRMLSLEKCQEIRKSADISKQEKINVTNQSNPPANASYSGSQKELRSSYVGWTLNYNSSELTIDLSTHDKLGQSGFSFETNFHSNDSSKQKEDFIIFILSRSNRSKLSNCAYSNPSDYFENVLKSRRKDIFSMSSFENEFFYTLEVKSKGFVVGKSTRDLFVHDFIVMPKRRMNMVYHIGGRFLLSHDALRFSDFFKNLRFDPNLDIYNFKC
jgi:hypothetical protein